MTTKLVKEIGSIIDLTFKGLGHAGPFSFNLVNGTVPSGIVFDPAKATLKGTLDKIGVYTFDIEIKKKDRIEGKEDFTFVIEDWTLVKTDFKTLVDYKGLTWEPLDATNLPVKIVNDPDLFDGECYELFNNTLKLSLPEPIGDRDFELELIIKVTNPNTLAGRLISLGEYNTMGTLIIQKTGKNTSIPIFLAYIVSLAYTDSYSNLIKNDEVVLRDKHWNHVLLVRKNGVMQFFINYVLVGTSNHINNLNQMTLYIGGNSINTQNFNTRIKRISLRYNDTRQFARVKYITDIWKYKFTTRNKIFLSPTDKNTFTLASTFMGNQTTRVKAGSSLPTGLILRNSVIQGYSALLDNLVVIIELLINNVVHDEIEITIISNAEPVFIAVLPLTGIVDDTVFGDTASRIWENSGNVKIVNDTDNYLNGTSTNFNTNGQYLSLTDEEFYLDREDFSISCWVKTNSTYTGTKTIFSLGSDYELGNIYCIVSGSDNKLTINYYYSGSNQRNLITNPIYLVNNEYSFIVFSRKNNIYRLWVNDKLVIEEEIMFSFNNKTLYIGNRSSGNYPFRGNIFDFKFSKYSPHYWSNHSVALVTRWSSFLPVYVGQLNVEIPTAITTTWKVSPVKYVLNPNSSLPLGVTLNEDGSFTGKPTVEFNSSVLVDCYIENTLNHNVILQIEIITDVKSRFLIQTLNVDISNNDFVINKNKNNYTFVNTSETFIPEVGPMFSLELYDPLTVLGSNISIPYNAFSLYKKAFCIEIDFCLPYINSLVSRGVTTNQLNNILFSCDANSSTGDYWLGTVVNNNLIGLLFKIDVSDSNPFTYAVLSETEYEPNKKYTAALTYDLDVLKFFLDGILIGTTKWTGWKNEKTSMSLGSSLYSSYDNGLYNSGFINNFKLYEGNVIYTKDYEIDRTKEYIKIQYPIIEPNRPYLGKIYGISNHVVTITNGLLPIGLTMSNDGTITGTTSVTSGTFPITFNVIKDTVIETFTYKLDIAKYLIDLDFSNPIINNTITDNVGNIFTVMGTTIIENTNIFTSNKAALFNGTDSYLKLPLADAFTINSSDFVIEAEVYLNENVLINNSNPFGIISQRFNNIEKHAFSVSIGSGSSNSGYSRNYLNYLASKNIVGVTLSNTGDGTKVNTNPLFTAAHCYTAFLEKNTKYKVKIVKKEGLITITINDLFVESVKIPKDFFLHRSNQDILIGCLNNQNLEQSFFNGYISYIKFYIPFDSDLDSELIKPYNIVSCLDIPNSTEYNIVDLNPKNIWSIPQSRIIKRDNALLFNKPTYLKLVENGDWDFNSSLFTIEMEFFVIKNSEEDTGGILCKQYNKQGSRYFGSEVVFINNENYDCVFNFIMPNKTNTGFVIELSLPLKSNKWNKISITRNHTKVYAHINGFLVEEIIVSNEAVRWVLSEEIQIGATQNYSRREYFNGKLRHLRVLKDIALYNSESYTDFKQYNNIPIITDNYFTSESVNKQFLFNFDSDNFNYTNSTYKEWVDKNTGIIFDSTEVVRNPSVPVAKLNNINVIRFTKNTSALYNNNAKAKFKNIDCITALIVFRKESIDIDTSIRTLFEVDCVGGIKDNHRFNITANNVNAINKFSQSFRLLDAGNLVVLSHTATLTTDWVIGFTSLNLKTGKASIYVNGVKQEFTIPSNSAFPDTLPTTRISIGNMCDTKYLNKGFDGDLATLLLDTNPLTDIEIDKLHGWAAHKYDLTRLLPDLHPYKTVRPLI